MYKIWLPHIIRSSWTFACRETLVGLGVIAVADLIQLGLALDRLRQPKESATDETILRPQP